MTAILSWPQCVKAWWCWYTSANCAVIQLMVGFISSVTPLHDPKLTYCQLKFRRKFHWCLNQNSRKLIWSCCLQNCCHFVQSLMCSGVEDRVVVILTVIIIYLNLTKANLNINVIKPYQTEMSSKVPYHFSAPYNILQITYLMKLESFSHFVICFVKLMSISNIMIYCIHYVYYMYLYIFMHRVCLTSTL